MSRIYAVESFVFGAVSWAYLTVEQSLGVDAALNTWQLLSVAVLSAVNLVGMGLVPAAPGGLELAKGYASGGLELAKGYASGGLELAKGYASSVLALWCFYVYCLAESLGGPRGLWGNEDAPAVFANATEAPLADPDPNKPCCANDDVGAMHRLFFFGEFGLFLIPAGVCMALLSIHLLLALASVAAGASTAWPGHAWGLGMQLLLNSLLILYFSGHVFPVCPDPSAELSVFAHSRVPLVLQFAACGVAQLCCVGCDAVLSRSSLRILGRLCGLLVALLFCLLVAVACQPRNMLTLPLCVYLGASLLPVGYGCVDALLSSEDGEGLAEALGSLSSSLGPALGGEQRPATQGGSRMRRITRWVMPLQAPAQAPPRFKRE